VAAWFAVAGAGAFAVVHGLVLGLGLPYWVEHATAVLLVAGLPLTLLAGVAERRQRGGTAVGMVRWLTWPRVRTAGAVMFGGLGTVTLSYAVMRHLGIGPPATLEARGKLGARDPVVLAEFLNRTTDSTLGPTLTEALRVDLSQSRAVTLADPQAVAATLERMERAPTLPLTLPLAREVARRSGAKAVVTGEIDPAGTGFVLSARVLAAADGQVLTAVRADAADDGHLLAALDQLSAGLRERIGESLRSVRASPPLADVTTASLDALAKYSEGARAVDLGDFERGIGLLRQATVLDTGFAMAYRKLAAGLDNIGAPLGDRVEAVTHAYAHRDRLTEIERLLAAAYYHTEIMFDLAAAETEYRAALDIEPTNPIALNNLALVLNDQRRWAAADTFAQRAVAGDSATDAHYANAVKAEAAEGHYAEAEATLAHLSRAEPQSALAPGLEGLLAVAQGRFPVAEQQFRRSAELERAGSMGAAHMAEIRLGLDEAQGHLARAEADVRAFMAAADARGLARDYLLGAIAAGWIDLTYRDRRDAALARLAGALRHHPLASIPPLDRPYPELAEFYAASGHVAEAVPLLAEFQRAVPAGLRRGQPERFAAAGAIALAQGRWRDAVAGYRAAYDSSDCTACGWFEIGMAYERDRQPDSAIAAYERILGTPGLPYEDVRPYAPPLASLRLGELYERRRDRPRAIRAYTRFVDFWKDGDPELQPTVRDARQRLARLAGEH
jgi:tetratricopeptide (TPR) repeat protein